MSSPDIANMNRARWVFEARALLQMEETKTHRDIEVLKTVLINVMGLNMLRPVTESGIPKKYADMTEDEQKSYLPLVGWLGRPEMLEKVSEQMDIEKAVEQSSQTDTEYERLVSAIDEAMGDMEPIIGSPVIQTNKALDERVKTLLSVESDI